MHEYPMNEVDPILQPFLADPQSPPPNRLLSVSYWLLSAVAVVLALGTATTYFISWKVVSGLMYAPRAKVVGTPAQVGLSYQSITFPAQSDGTVLRGWLIPATGKGDKVVIEAHGFRGNRDKDEPALPMAKALHNAGIAVMMFDFRDEGESDGHMVTVGYYEQRDLQGAIQYAQSLGYQHIGLLGFSMGASTAIETAAANNDVEAVAADSPFADFYTYLEDRMPVWTHLPKWPFTPEILWEVRTFTGIDVHAVSPLRDLAHWKPRPLLLIAGTADTLIPMQNSQQLYSVVKGEADASLWIVAGAKHVGAHQVEPTAYEQRVTQFFLKFLH